MKKPTRIIYKLHRFTFSIGFFFLICLFSQAAFSQQFALPPSEAFRQDRFKKVVINEAAFAIVASAGLYFLWYKKFPRSRFHYFNDNAEWLQMDKAGHLTSAYNIASFQNDIMRWCGVKPNASLLIGSVSALAYMSIIEVLDGFSTQWGFSKGDMLANIAGTALFASQQKWWGMQRATLKYSFHASPYAQYNPKEFGTDLKSKILKDYNGQTIWLSLNIKSFLPQNNNFPAWANVAMGYGIEGVLAARSNPAQIDGKPVPYFKRTRQYYLAPDADFFRLQSASGFVNGATYYSKLLKIPAPALEYNSEGRFKFYPLYY